jgi:hypothetical protein
LLSEQRQVRQYATEHQEKILNKPNIPLPSFERIIAHMSRNRKISIVSVSVLVIVALLHFVPFDSRSGYMDRGLANLCVGYGAPTTYTYRWINGGVNQWDNDINYLKNTNSGCAQPATIKLYIL